MSDGGGTDNGKGSSIGNVPLAVLTAVAGGIGGVGFFTFVGGAITIARLRGAGISGTSAVARVPKLDLFVLGVDALLLPTLVALLVSLIFVVVLDIKWTSGKWVLVGAAVFGVLYFAWRMNYWLPVGKWSTEAKDAFLILIVVGLCGVAAVLALAVRAKKVEGHAAETAEAARESSDQSAGYRDRARATAERLNPASKGPGSLVPAGVLLFIVAVVFSAAGEYALGYVHPQVRAAAVALKGAQPPVSGIYIGDSDNRVWIAKVHPRSDEPNLGGGGGYLVGIPRSEVTHILIGRTHRLPSIEGEVPCLLKEVAAVPAAGPRC